MTNLHVFNPLGPHPKDEVLEMPFLYIHERDVMYSCFAQKFLQKWPIRGKEPMKPISRVISIQYI